MQQICHFQLNGSFLHRWSASSKKSENQEQYRKHYSNDTRPFAR